MNNAEPKFTPDEHKLFHEIAEHIKNNPKEYAQAGKWLDECCSESVDWSKLWSKDKFKKLLEKEVGEKRTPALIIRFNEVRKYFFDKYQDLDLISKEDAKKIILITWLITDPDAENAKLNITELEKWEWGPLDDITKLSRGLKGFLFFQNKGPWMRLVHVAWGKTATSAKEKTLEPKLIEKTTPKPCYKKTWAIIVGVIIIIGGIWTVIQIYESETFKTLFVQPIDLETDFPAKFGDSREDVWKHLGKPQEERVVWDCFYSEGLNIYYDRHKKEVDGFHIFRLPSGVSYPGRVLGVRLGDSFDKAKMLHGHPEHWGLPEEDASLAVWQKDNNLRLIITASRSGPDAGRILSITYCRENSFANYIPITATTLQELRNRRPLSFAEEGGDPFFASELRPDNPLFQMPYNIVDASLGMMGGAIITVCFENSEVVLLWIYPFNWTQPRVRMIVKPDEIGSG